MHITKDIINDLLPPYASNECSADTRALVEEYLRAHPREAAELQRAMSEPLPGQPPAASGLQEMRSLKEARRRVRRGSYLMGLAIFFSLLPFSFLYTDGRVYWLFRQAPVSALIYAALGVACWISYAVARQRSRIL